MICHAGWIPISAGIMAGRTVTSTPGIKDDLTNAGATWVDRAVVTDGHSLIAIHGSGEGKRTWTGITLQVADVVAGK